MLQYRFQVIGPRGSVRIDESRRHSSITGVWRRVYALALRNAELGERLHVIDERGDTIIRVGVRTARTVALTLANTQRNCAYEFNRGEAR